MKLTEKVDMDFGIYFYEDIFWTDNQLNADFYYKLKPYQ